MQVDKPIELNLLQPHRNPGGAEIREIVFFGTGTSGCVPAQPCLTKPDVLECTACIDAFFNPYSKNRRNNTSALVRIWAPQHQPDRLLNVLIDCGKTFYQQAIQWCTLYQIRHLDAVLLTHSHADAMFGLDDLRQWTLNGAVQSHVDIYLNQNTMEFCSSVFPYLVDTTRASGGGDVSSLRFHLLERVNGIDGEYKPLNLYGLEVLPFEVEHGKFKDRPFMSLGFRFGLGDFVYISDVSRIPDHSAEVLREYPINVFVVDGLHDKAHPSHFNIEQAIECLKQYRPRLGLLTGFSHRVDHESVQSRLDQDLKQNKGWELDTDREDPLVKLAWDGLCLRCRGP